MNTRLTSRSICVIAFGGWAALASALSLGPLTGAPVIGRPLELVAPIQFDESSTGNNAGCVTAQVLYGDNAVDAARVDVDLGAQIGRQTSYARISSVVPVDEPFVTVVLHAGCTRPFTKRYVLLAEAPRQDPMVLASAPALAVPVPVPVPVQPAVAGAATQARAEAPVPAAWTARVVSRGDRPAPARRTDAVAREAAPRASGRLQLAVWDPNSAQLPWLRTSSELKSSPTQDEARRAAATSLWRALNARPEDLLRTAERLRGLEGEVNALRSLSTRHRDDIATARESLQSTRQRNNTTLLVVTLLALLTGSAAAWIWHRSRRPSDAGMADSWYSAMDPWAESNLPLDADPAGVAGAPAARSATVVTPVPDVPRLPESVPHAAPVPEPPAAPLADLPGLKVDALHGAQQQSEFFASLGQVDEAVAVLTSYLEESREQPVLAFLELLRIYHGTGMRMEYEELQSRFRKAFGMDVASFGEYSDEPRELDMYLLPVTRIAAAWPSERSQEIIEELLFNRPATPRDLLSLQAYRDLVWLYALGQEVVHQTGSPAGLQLRGDRGLPNDHFILPWADPEHEEPTELSLDRLDTIDVAPELTSFGVDIDLTAVRSETHGATEVRLPQVEDPLPAEPQDPDHTAFDAAMESESRRAH